MSHRYTHFLIDVPIAGDPDLIAQADDTHLLDHAADTLVETAGETAAGWFEPDGVTDGTATFRLRIGTSHAGEPTDTEAIHAALRVLREHTADAPLDAGALQYDHATPTGPLGESAAPGPEPENTGGIDTDTETDTERDTAEPAGSNPAKEPEPDTDDRKYGIERDGAADGRQGLLASAMRGNG
ncbi:hypothetical protein [Halorubrum sp. CSM-61]|uniref:hypothetical protein n=1 Tax=Halorubrum sp. CSM-61 TaxID=2485838 RepID=UPI000F4B70B1|nr:hypothetical protein [Halorubrum sp. CSM-61]